MTTTIDELREQHERIKLENEMAMLSAETTAINGAAFPGMHVAEAQHLQEAWGDLVPVDEYPGMSGWDGGYNHRGSGLWNTIGAQLGDRSRGQDEQVFQDEIEHARIRAIGRLLCNVSVNAICAKENLTSYILGTGFAYKVVSQDGQKASSELLAAVQSVVNEVLRDNKWWVNREEQLFERSRRDGEYFAALYHTGSGHVAIRTIEPEQVTEPDDPTEVARYYDLADRPYSWSFGICTDDDDMEAVHGYYVRWRTAEGRDTARFFPSERMAHCKLNVDNNIKRGISDFYCIYEHLIDAGKLLRNTTKGHAIMSAIAFIRQHAQGVTGAQVESMRATSAWSRYQQPTRTEGTRTQYTHHYAPGTIVDVPNGQEYKAGPMAGQGVGQAAVEVEQATLRIAGSRWCMPEYMISGDASNAAYASTLAAESPFVKYCQRQQNIYRHHYTDIFWKALWIAYCAGRFDHLDVSWEEIQAVVNLHVEVPIVQSRDRNIETNRLRVLRDAGIISDGTWAAEEGYEHERELKRGAKEHQQPSPFGGGDQAGFPVAGNAVGKAEGSVREGMREAFDESQHPRGDDGRFISKGDLQAAAKDPRKAEELRARVTDPKQRAKLEKAIGGKPKASKQTDSPEFKRWFGDSKVVDGEGKPLRVFHGTSDELTEFDLSHPGRKDTGWLGTGVYLTTSEETAGTYANLKPGPSGPSILPLYARLSNPYHATLEDKLRLREISQSQGEKEGRKAADVWTQQLKAKGHDGVVLELKPGAFDKGKTQREIVVFDTSAVKSATGNRGTFDPKSPKITESRLQEAAALLWGSYPGTGGAACPTRLTEHKGPGDHSSGSPQDVHGGGGSGGDSGKMSGGEKESSGRGEGMKKNAELAAKHDVPIEVVEFVEKGIQDGKTRAQLKREFEGSELSVKNPQAKSKLSPIFREKTGAKIPKASYGQRQAAGRGKVYRDPRATVEETDLADMKATHSALTDVGAKLDARSEFGSRYYTMPSGQKVRVSNHPPTPATANWMKEQGVVNVQLGTGGESAAIAKMLAKEKENPKITESHEQSPAKEDSEA